MSLSGIPDRYRPTHQETISVEEAAEEYQRHRLGEIASRKANGFQGTLYRRARRKCACIHSADRQFRDEMENPVLLLITLAGSWNPTHDKYGPLVAYERALARAIDEAWSTIRYRLLRETVEYVIIEAGTERGTPHRHLLVWMDTKDCQVRRDAERAIQKFQTKMPQPLREFDPDDSPPDEAIRIDQSPNTNLESYPGDPNGKPAHPLARYTANQLPHIGMPTQDENAPDGTCIYGAVADASSIQDWRSSHGVSTISP
jgi:hypothetical protein